MNKSKHFIFAVMATAITLLIFGSRAASAQATHTGIFNATPKLSFVGEFVFKNK